jgi:CRISPR/Cas system endoribonuclease Cas6 (RAMP superfamily)
MRECEGCERSSECLFYANYQNPSAKKGHAPPPRPIILTPPFFGKEMEFAGEAKLELKLLMFGDYARYFPYVILALQQFGSHGLGDARHFDWNKFEVAEAKCEFSDEVVYDGGTIYPSNLKSLDVRELPQIEQKHLRLGFRTPIELPAGFPPLPEHLLQMVRQRLILLANEYGSGEKVPGFACRGLVKTIAKHYHQLIGYSQRSGRREFWNCWTGIADYDFEELDETGRWLLGVGRVLGAGAKSSFGCGFFDVFSESADTRKSGLGDVKGSASENECKPSRSCRPRLSYNQNLTIQLANKPFLNTS